MTHLTKRILVCLAVLLSVVLLASVVFAATGKPERPPGEPPYGVAVQSDAQGIKLTGVLVIEYYPFYIVGTQKLADLRAILRLRKGNDLYIFYCTATGVDSTNPNASVAAIAEKLEGKILSDIFNNDYTEVTLKSLEEYTDKDILDENGKTHSFVLTDIVLAVK